MSLEKFESWMRNRINQKETFLKEKKKAFSKSDEFIPHSKLIESGIISCQSQLIEDKLILSKYLEAKHESDS